MKKNIKKLIALVLVLSVLSSLVVFAENNNTIEKQYTITIPYQYPVVPGTKKWSELESLDEMIKVCQIPNDVLTNISTEALIETVIDYPLAINMFAFDTPQEGYNSIKMYFNGVQELETRSDAINEINKRILTSTEKNKNSIEGLIEKVILAGLVNKVVSESKNL